MACDKTSHYGISMNISSLKEWAENRAKEIVKRSVETDTVPVLIYTGMSGITAATALAFNFPEGFRYILEYVRKEEEQSHGCKVEISDSHGRYSPPVRTQFYLVDDFICTGSTFTKMMYLYQNYRQVLIDPEKILVVLSACTEIIALQIEDTIESIRCGNIVVAENKAKQLEATKDFLNW